MRYLAGWPDGFTPEAFYWVSAASVINNTAGEPLSGTHSDTQKMPVAQLIVTVAGRAQLN